MHAKLIQRLIDNEQFSDVFDDNSDESFYGYVSQQSDDLIQLECYDEEGRFDGVMVLEKDDVSRIRWGNGESQIVEGLIPKRSRVPKLNLESLTDAARGISDFYGYLCLTLGQYGTDVLYIGEISEELEDSLILHEFGTRARNERSFLMLRWDDVTRVQAGGCLLYTSPSPRDKRQSRMPSSA